MGALWPRNDDGATWRLSEPGMYVGTAGSVTLGYVIDVSDGFVAFDADARPVARCRSLRAAKRAVCAAGARSLARVDR
ncbi:hypothetical protein [Microbacterium oleivorans]|uniref:Uncharacterized protein n=1 Tax=Microbacterium oleivorans TaxID=273677 RepID=A0A7D5IQX9_9MICO|nr:hypothetical protein [Microbacterium oleivorans]QLD12101.1 hypothetical protein HW566_10190 [Microbacterium oleivorans]